ncbi:MULTISPECIES: TetR/AcrR family transcriptional regulator [unclassified Microbacterium]|uniref:TetR/AcrR family transcriptional regulator n=1 Tax=unclassified Microbacterium TaxID=2609290 RepID=UPI0030176307
MNAPSETRSYLPRADRRERLLDAALDVVAESGAASLSLRSVAERAGVAHRVVSYAFGSKTELVAALLRRESQRTLASVWATPLRDESLPAAVRAALAAYARDLVARPAAHAAVAELTAAARGADRIAVAEEAALARRAIADRLDEWCALTGARLSVPRELVATVLLICADGLAAWQTTAPEAGPDAVLDTLSAGFAHLQVTSPATRDPAA